MSDTLKIQMTEEQAVLILRCATYNLFDTESERKEEINSMIISLKNNGYICKSSLQQKVEEAEEMYIEVRQIQGCTDLEELQHDVIQLLKQSHPEFKK